MRVDVGHLLLVDACTAVTDLTTPLGETVLHACTTPLGAHTSEQTLLTDLGTTGENPRKGNAPASLMAFSMHMPTPRPSARGSVMWCASQVSAPPRYSQMMLAPRFCACSSDSMTRTPAPSPMTKPSRPLSHGRDARAMRSLFDDSALHSHQRLCCNSHISASQPRRARHALAVRRQRGLQDRGLQDRGL